MTREEAKEILTHNWTRVDNPNYSDSEMDEAFFMAIEALQREEAEEKGYCHRIKPKEYFSADAEWIPFKKRPLTDEEKQEYPDWTYIFDCPLPDDEEEILLSNGKYVWTDTFINDGECYLDGGDDIDDGMAWMPLPKPYKGGEEEPGQWQTENRKPSKAEYSVYCSKCGFWSEYRTKYCGSCGSLMKEENDDK